MKGIGANKKRKVNKAPFSMKMDKDLLDFVTSEAEKKDRSKAYIVEKALQEAYGEKINKFLQDRASKISQTPLFP
jgi:predicted transcriptional regulator